ncbi:MAG: LysE family translocator, partial [Psychromonas sp.]
MVIEIIAYLPEIISVSVIAIFMAISPGADFVMITRNSVFYSRTAGLYSALGISFAIWLHVIYSIAGLAILISKSIILFSVLKYLGAAYLVYVGWKTFTSKDQVTDCYTAKRKTLSNFSAFKMGFISNALNPKTTMFFLSVFT